MIYFGKYLNILVLWFGILKYETVQEIQLVYGEDPMSVKSIMKWLLHFKRWAIFIEIDTRSDRPSTSCYDEVMKQV